MHQQLAGLAQALRLRPGQAYEYYLEDLSSANAPADREIYLPVQGDLTGAQRLAGARTN